MEVGDYVNVLPYNRFQDHIGISKKSWDDIVAKNPHRIRYISGIDVSLEDSYFTWDITMVEPHYDDIIIPDIISMV